MNIQNYLSLMLLFVYRYEGVLTCTVTDNNEALNENITVQENAEADFIYHLREETSPTFNDTFFLIEIKLCQNEKYQDVCRCRWRTKDNILCTSHRNVSICEADNHVMRFSLLVKRTYSHILWELMRSSSPLVVLRNTKLRVTYPPKVTGLQVNGREVNETLVVEENQEVSVSCSFTNGNPPVTVRLVDKTGQTQNSTKHGVGPLVMSVGGFGCQDVWPVITCEAPGSELKRSVAILVRFCLRVKEGGQGRCIQTLKCNRYFLHNEPVATAGSIINDAYSIAKRATLPRSSGLGPPSNGN